MKIDAEILIEVYRVLYDDYLSKLIFIDLLANSNETTYYRALNVMVRFNEGSCMRPNVARSEDKTKSIE